MSESVQKKLGRIRPPRVQITYDVETGGAIEKKELPLVVGILADLAGKSEKTVPIKERKFVEIDRDNFNAVCASIAPRLAFQVPNRLPQPEGAEATNLNLELNFNKIDSFRPESIIQQVEPLKKLFEARQKLNDLIAKLDGNDDLDALLQDIAKNTDKQQKIKEAVGGPTNG